MELADLEYAKNVARRICSSFPNQAHDPLIFGAQLTKALEGRPKSALQALVDPRTGYLATAKFLTIADVNEWLDNHRPAVYSPPYKRLAPPEPPPPTPEERARVEETWRRARRQFQAAALHMRSGFQKERRPSTTLTKDELEALERYIANPETP